MQFALVFAFIIGFQLLVTHAIALSLHLYWVFWWLDIVMHTLGGVWLVCVWRVLTDMNLIKVRFWKLKFILPVLTLVMIGWEIFGVYLDRGFKDGYVTDTAGDILCGIVGALIGFWLLHRLQILNK